MLHILQGGQFFVKACIVFIMHSIYFLPVAQKKICCIIVAAADVFVRILQRLLSATFILPDFPRRIVCLSRATLRQHHNFARHFFAAV